MFSKANTEAEKKTDVRRVRQNDCEKKPLASLCLSVLPHGIYHLPLDTFSQDLISRYFLFYENLSTYSEFGQRRTEITVDLH